MRIIRIDPDEIQPIKTSELFSEIRFVELKTPEGVTPGDIDHVFIAGNTILTLDTFRSRTLVGFDLDGNYRFDLGRQHGRGPGEITGAYDIAIEEDRNRFLVYDAARLRIIAYHLETGRFLTEYPIGMYIDTFRRQGDGYIIFQNNRITPQTDKLVVFTDSLFNIKKQFMDIPEEYHGVHWHRPHYLTPFKDVHYLARPYDSNIYRLDDDTVTVHARLEFVRDGLPDDFLKVTRYNQLKERTPEKDAARKLESQHYHGPWSYYESDDLIFTEYRHQTGHHFYFHHKKTGKTINTNASLIEQDHFWASYIGWAEVFHDGYFVNKMTSRSLHRFLNAKQEELSAEEWVAYQQQHKNIFDFQKQLGDNDNPYLVFGKVRL